MYCNDDIPAFRADNGLPTTNAVAPYLPPRRLSMAAGPYPAGGGEPVPDPWWDAAL